MKDFANMGLVVITDSLKKIIIPMPGSKLYPFGNHQNGAIIFKLNIVIC